MDKEEVSAKPMDSIMEDSPESKTQEPAEKSTASIICDLRVSVEQNTQDSAEGCGADPSVAHTHIVQPLDPSDTTTKIDSDIVPIECPIDNSNYSANAAIAVIQCEIDPDPNVMFVQQMETEGKSTNVLEEPESTTVITHEMSTTIEEVAPAVSSVLSASECKAVEADVPDISKTVPPALGVTSDSSPTPIEDVTHFCDVNEEPTPTGGSPNASGLALLASQYDSGSDSDDVCEVPINQTYQNRFVEIDSDSSTSDVEILSEVRGPINLDIMETGHGEEDDEENVRTSRTPMVKGELHLDDLPPIQNLHITVPEEECAELGKVQSIIEQLVIVNSLPGTVPLDLDTVLFLDKGKQVLGEIFDVLGQVSDPLYCVRFNTNKEIREKKVEVGQTVYVAPRTQHTQFIVLANLMKLRGSDASWENDIEPPEKFLDYSDDEEERSARRTMRNRNRPSDADDEGPKRQRAGESTGPNCGVHQPQRPFRGNYYGPRQPHYQPPSNYDIAGNSWHSNYYQNYTHPHQQPNQYQMPIRPPTRYRHPLRNMGPRAPPTHPGLVVNPYAVFPPPPLMQQPLFPPPQQPPPPPPPQHGGYL